MMTDKKIALDALRQYGKSKALNLQNKSAKMTGTELNAEENYIPDFSKAKNTMNMLERKPGFVCKSTAGRVVRLLQVYDSDIYPQEPEELSAQWGFAWSTDPEKAKPFIALATSPYNTGDCCYIEDSETFENKVYSSKMDGNVHSPIDYPDGWELVNTNA